MFKSEIRNSRAQPRRARAAAQSGRACGAIARGQSPQRAVGVRLAERASAACSSRSASNDACSALHAACMRIAGGARVGPPARLQRQLVLPKRGSGTTLQRRRRQRQCERLTLSAAAVHSVLHAAPCSPSSPAAASAHRQLLQQSQQQPFFIQQLSVRRGRPS